MPTTIHIKRSNHFTQKSIVVAKWAHQASKVDQEVATTLVKISTTLSTSPLGKGTPKWLKVANVVDQTPPKTK